MTAARPPRWGDLPLDRLEELVAINSRHGLSLRAKPTARGMNPSHPATVSYPIYLGAPGPEGQQLLVDELIALARWAAIARKISDGHPRWSAGRVLGTADDVAAGVMSLAAAEGLK